MSITSSLEALLDRPRPKVAPPASNAVLKAAATTRERIASGLSGGNKLQAKLKRA